MIQRILGSAKSMFVTLDGSILQQGVSAFQLLPYVSHHNKKLLKEIARDMILIYLVVTHHGWSYQNQNVVDIIGYRGVYQMPILSQLSILGKMW
jgi:hypothetical protein